MTTSSDPSTSSTSPGESQPPPRRVPGHPATRRRVDRRTLIGAGAGLLVGVGATQAANSLPSAADAPIEPGPPPPAEALMTEHGVLKRLLLVYQEASAQLAAGHTPPAAPITATAEMITDVIEGFHEGLEEAYVFPRLQPVQPNLIHTLLVQHDRGRHLTAAISDLSTQNLQREAVRASLRRDLDLFVAMYAHHEAWEDTIVFPAIRTTMTRQTLDELGTRFWELESAQYGPDGYAKLLDRVRSIEQQLDIANLAAFTPPEINPPYV